MDPDAYRPTSAGPTALFLDTSGLFARFSPDTREHGHVVEFFDAIGSGELPYRPLVTNTYVIDELATLLASKASHDQAVTALDVLANSEAVTVSREREGIFDRAREAFLNYDDHQLSFTDHYCAAEMHEQAVDHVLAFDDDYEVFDFSVLPRT